MMSILISCRSSAFCIRKPEDAQSKKVLQKSATFRRRKTNQRGKFFYETDRSEFQILHFSILANMNPLFPFFLGYMSIVNRSVVCLTRPTRIRMVASQRFHQICCQKYAFFTSNERKNGIEF